VSKPAIPQPLKQIIAITRAPGRGLQHLPLNIMMSLQMLQPRGRAPSALARTAKVEDDVREALILGIAQRRFFIVTLETRNRDRLDFHDVAVWAIHAALEDAFEAGRRAGAADKPQS
jgi:hypothetical protein